MATLSPDIMERYVAYKNKVLAHYNLLLEEHCLTSARILIEALRTMESKHMEDTQTNCSMICPVSVDFSNHLSLTPIHELEHVSKVFEKIIAFREQALNEHFGEFNNETIQSLKAIEQDIHRQMMIERQKYHI